MSRCRRPNIEGWKFFFTVVHADRRSGVLVKQIERLRQVYRAVQARLPFATNAIGILPDHPMRFGHCRPARPILSANPRPTACAKSP
jgi:REP element-mobilizing transposase RayT